MSNYLFINNEKAKYVFTWIKASKLITNENQTRNRNESGSIAQINQIAANLQPELLAQSFELSTGAPVIDQDFNIISGHGRILAIKSAFYNDKDGVYYKYNNHLQQNILLCDYANILTGINDCYILCRMIENKYNTFENVHNANNATLSYTPYELAKINAKRLKPDVNQWVKSLPLLEQSQYFTDNLLNLRCYQDYQNAKIIAALPNCTILADFINYPNPDFKNVITAILNNIDKILDIQENNIELFNQFALALDKFLQIKQNNGTIDDFLLQLDMFDSGLNGADFSNCLNILWNNTRSAKALTSELALFLNKTNNLDLFADSNEPLILDNTISDNNESIQLLTPLPSNKITPRYWQQKAINDVENAITHGKNRLLISAPTGSGKAYLLMFIIQQLLQANKRILLLVDRIKLVDQLCESAKIFNFDYNKIQGSIRDYNNDRLLTIASIQTYFNNPVATEYDVIIQDECHSQYSALTEYLQNHKGTAIGCTATPYSAGLIDIYTYLIETQTAAELTADKVLTPLRPFEMREIDMVGAKIVAGEWAANDVHKRSAKIYGDVVREFRCSHVYDKQGIVFCANIAHCNDVAERFIRANVTCAVYCSMQSLKERQEILAKFDNNEIQLLISVATLSKGFDRPQIEVILDLRPLRKSLNEYIQMIGRGIRANKGKNECVLLDFSGNWDRFKDKVLLAHNHGAGLLLDVINANVSAKQLKRNSKRLNTVRTQSITNNPLTELTNGVQLVESEFTASNDNNLFVPPPSRKIGILKTIFNFLRK